MWALDGDRGLESCSVKVTQKYSALLAKDIVVNNNNQIIYAVIRQLAFDLGLKRHLEIDPFRQKGVLILFS